MANIQGGAKRRFGKQLSYSASVTALFLGAFVAPAQAQEAGAQFASAEDIIVTGSRRSSTVQESSINIAAVSAEKIESLGLANLTDASRSVPGIYVLDQGARGSARVIVRGLNADGLGSAEGIENDGGGTVATYVGEIPLFVNLKLNDMERVEYLFGPQGTLYGAGTLGGAIRYIPTKPKFDAATASIRSDFYSYSEGHGISGEGGITVNQPITDTFAIRASVDRVDDNGFIDYDYAVRQPGVSNPDPDFSDPADVAANINPVRDANFEETWSGRVAARWAPNDIFDATLTYYFQDQDVGARQISSRRSILSTGKYVSNQRVTEPSNNKNDLIALETITNLVFADLTVAAGYSRYKEKGSRDQTDLLIGLEYSYEAFPNFTAFTREDEKDTTTTFEPRLVSKLDGPLQFIAGAFYNRFNGWSQSLEFTPGYAQYNGINRPDNLEY
ncbi:MAG: TonB-dependent receptor plug domain-containing protein, partial [Caulobacterales bacterium]